MVLNAGSSSLKLSVLTAAGSVLLHEQRDWSQAAGRQNELERLLEVWFPQALAPWLGPGGSGLLLAGHRVVHGGLHFTEATAVNAEVLAAIETLVPLAPLHNAVALRLMRWLGQWLPGLPQWACFDTAFHASLSVEEYTYAIPASWRRQGLRRFGFHGLNHQHVSEVVQRHWRRAGRRASPRLISAHLGAGCSLCAIAEGRSVATTMGFTPMEGLVMASRCGSIDPGLLLHQLRQGLSPADLDLALNQQGGLLGLSERTADMRELRRLAAGGAGVPADSGASLAIAVFRRRLLQGIGAMAASLQGLDVLALTGGIGEHDGELRAELEAALAWLQPFELLVVSADEEGMVARSCLAALAGA
ncbi:MAG: acetate kinase [Cyanobium sp.]